MREKSYRKSDIVQHLMLFKKEDVFSLLSRIWSEFGYRGYYDKENLIFIDAVNDAAYDRNSKNPIDSSDKYDRLIYDTYHLFDTLDELPIHINDPEPLGRLVVKWRLEKGI